MSAEIPQWAVAKAFTLANKAGANWAMTSQMLSNGVGVAFARYIAEHEEPPPIDPLLIEARTLVAERCDSTERAYRNFVMNGDEDDSPAIRNTLAALKRGIEIGKTYGEGE